MVKLFFNVILLLVCSLTHTSLFSQSVEIKYDIFPASIAHTFHQDKIGFIWIGTQEGLLRYDGIDFKHYTNIPFDSTSLSNNWIFDIEEDKSGNLWIATFGGGLNYFDQRTGLFHRYAGNNQDKINHTTKIIVNDDQSVWFTSTTHGLTYLSFGKDGQPEYKHFRFSEDSINETSVLKNSALTMHKGKDGLIWVGMATEGLIRFNPQNGEVKQFINITDDPLSISHNTISAICEDDSGNIWIGTGHPNVSRWGAGLNMYDRKKDIFRHFKVDFSGGNSICSNEITSLLIDKTGTLWLGSPNNYLNTVSLKEIIAHDKPFFHHFKNLYKPFILTLYEDRQGNIWIGQLTMQSQKYDRRQNPFALFSRTDNYPNSLTSSGTWIVYADHSGRIWFGNEGLDVYDLQSGSFQHYYYDENNPNGLSENMIIGIQEDSDGQIWIATWHKGIDILNPLDGNFKHLRHDPRDSTGLSSNTIQQILNRTGGGLWIASQGAVLQLYDQKKKKFHTFKLNPQAKNDFIISNLYEDRSGVLWIGTVGTGMYSLRLDKQLGAEIIHYKHEPQNRFSIGSDAITDIIQPDVVDTASLWIGTSSGLNRLDLITGKFSHFSREDGLSTNYIAKILEDNQGNLWCATTNGLSEYKIKTGQFRKYNKSDGLPFTSFGAGRLCATRDKEGRLYFAGGDGVLSFQPDSFPENTAIPPIVITDFQVFQKSVLLDTAIQFKQTVFLDYNQNIFSFQFAALNFTAPEKNQYTYKMEGFVDDWINIGNERTATFTNLDPGQYIFHVKGSNNDGVWNEKGASVKVIILPPWWATWWFRSIIIISLVVLVYALYKYRVNRILEMEHVRMQIATDLHDDVGSSLTKIAVHSEIIQNTQDKKKIASSSVKIGITSREIITSLSDIIWSIDARNDKVGDLIDRMRDYLDTVFPPGSITIDFQTQGLEFNNNIDQVLRQNIYLIFKEAVNNAAKYSDASKLNILMTNGNGRFRLEISDDGKGMELNEKSVGYHGLQNMKLRAERIGGEFKIENNNGTRIILTVKEL